jgi:integrase
VNGVVTFGEPKTEGSRRAVPIPQWLADALEVRWIGDFATMSRPSPQDFAFTTPHGHPWPRTRFAARVWKPAVKLAQIDPPANFHDLRRAYASMLIAAGLNPKVSRPEGPLQHQDHIRPCGHLMPGSDSAVARSWHESASEELEGRDAAPTNGL